MTTNLFRLYRTAADVLRCRAAPAPSGGIYVAEGDLLSSFAAESTIMRLSSSGSILWSKLVTCTDGGASVAHPWLASNATHLAVAHEWGEDGVVLYDSDGNEVWSTQLPLSHTASTGVDPWSAPPIALGPDNSVFVLGETAGVYEEAILVKLNAATGAIDWSVNLRDNASSAGTDWPGSLAVLSGGDVIVHVRGALNYVLRLDGSDGSVVWSKGVVWPSGSAETAVGVDPSDNVYLAGRAHISGTRILPVVKLDSDGNVLWNRQVEHASGLTALALKYLWSGRLTCDATGVFIPCRFDNSTSRAGHVFVPAAGTVAAGTALVATFESLSGISGNIGAAGGTDTPSVFAYQDKASPSATYNESIVVTAGSSSGEDGTWDTRDRTTYAFDVTAGSATVTTQTYTRASMPSFSDSAFSHTNGSSTLLVESYTVVYDATSVAPATAFGTPRWTGYVIVDPYTPSTAFGAPRVVTNVDASSVASATAFGTPALNLNKTVSPSSVESALAFGLPWSERDPAPQPIVADSTDPTTAFGTPAATSARSCAASGFSSTAFGTPVLGLAVSPEGFAVGAFGTPILVNTVRAAGAAPATVFGRPVKADFGAAASIAPATAFGTPLAWADLQSVASGASSTAFGTPSCLHTTQRTRSGVFRTQWGLAQAERTVP